MFVKIINKSAKKFTQFKKIFNLIDFATITSRNNNKFNNNQSQLNILKTNKQNIKISIINNSIFFNNNDVKTNYVTLLIAKQTKKKRLQIKRKYIIVVIKNKQLRISLQKKNRVVCAT